MMSEPPTNSALHVQLRDGRPVGVVLDALADPSSSTLMLQIVHAAGLRISTRGRRSRTSKLGRAFHEKHHSVVLDDLGMRFWASLMVGFGLGRK